MAASLDSEARALLDTLVEQTAAALERASLAREMVNAKTATETERVRNTLLASISHDFRTPLSSILGSATSLIDYGDKLDPAAKKDLLGQIKTRSRETSTRWCAICSPLPASMPARWNCGAIGSICAKSSIASSARRGGMARASASRSTLPADLPLVRADATLVEQAIGNVIGNAIVHTPPDSRVTIGAQVAADGSRSASPMTARAFRSTRCRISSTNSSRGPIAAPPAPTAARVPGLGLAITKGIMEAHGGSIKAESPAANGRGARFVMTFRARGDAGMSAKIRVLVIDDETPILRFLKPALEANNYEMTSAGTVAEAIKRIAAETPDIVLLDLGLPDGDGKDVIKRAREWSDVPIIVLSARERETEKIEVARPRRRRLRQQAVQCRRTLGAHAHGAAAPHAAQGRNPAIARRQSRSRFRASPRHPRAAPRLKLTPKEFELLSFLAKHAGRVVTHKQILTAVWGPAHAEDTQYLRVYVGQLRQKVEEHADDPRIILTEPGIGYRIAES